MGGILNAGVLCAHRTRSSRPLVSTLAFRFHSCTKGREFETLLAEEATAASSIHHSDSHQDFRCYA